MCGIKKINLSLLSVFTVLVLTACGGGGGGGGDSPGGSNNPGATSTGNPPVVTDAVVTVDEDMSLTIQLLDFATDPDNDVISLSSVDASSAQNGQIADNGDGSVTFTPAMNFNGQDSFSFAVEDQTSASASGTVTINVNPINDPPTAMASSGSTLKDIAFSGQLSADDIDGDALTFSVVNNGAIGVVSLSNATTGEFVYTPNANSIGSDSFSFKVSDGMLDSDAAIVTVDIFQPSTVPMTQDSTLNVTEDLAAAGQLSGNDVDGDALTFSIETSPTKGVVTLDDASTGAFSYMPMLNETGNDSFTFKATSGGQVSNISTVSIVIAAVSDAPVTQNGTFNVTEDLVATGQLSGNDSDGDPLTFSIETLPTKGTLTLDDASTGAFTYTPLLNENGNDSFTFKVTAGGQVSNISTESIVIAAVNDLPLAEGKHISVQDNDVASGTLKATDIDGDTLTFSIETNGVNGTAQITDMTKGVFSYMSNNVGQDAEDSFTFKVTDAAGETATAIIDVSIDGQTDSILFLVAHPDDETVIGAGVIKNAILNQESLNIVSITNGDGAGLNQGMLRQVEAEKALGTLGVNPNNIIFLGYPDNRNGGLVNIVNDYIDGTTSYTSNATQLSNTYGEKGLGRNDFHTYQTGNAAGYNKPGLLDDIKSILRRYRPTKIYTHSPLDQHPDHRMTYLLLTEALAAAMKGDDQLRPEVFTAIVHSPKDYPFIDRWAVNTFPPSIVSPDFSQDAVWPAPAFVGTLGNFDDMIKRFTPDLAMDVMPDLINTPLLWANRLNMPVPAEMQVIENINNLKFTALNEYKTQHAAHGLVFGFGKNEEVFWKTDWQTNIALIADITASSESSNFFQLAANVADGIVDGFPGNYQAEWATADGASVGETITLTWSKDYTVSEIRLYDRPMLDKQITQATITFSDGTSIDVGALPNDGFTPLVVSFNPILINSLTVEITGFSDTTLGTAGFAEIEVISAPNVAANSKPYFVDGPFASAYEVDANGELTMGVLARDEDGDAITYTWQSAQGGTFGGAGGTSVVYSAPTSVNTVDIITVTIDDGVNTPLSAQFAVNVGVINVAPFATVTASSETVATEQLAIKAIDGVIDGFPGDFTKEWATLGDGANAWIQLDWQTPQSIDSVLLYDRPVDVVQILSGTLVFSDGVNVIATIPVVALPNDGQTPLVIDLSTVVPPITNVMSVRFEVATFLQANPGNPTSGELNVGLAEFKVGATPLVN